MKRLLIASCVVFVGCGDVDSSPKNSDVIDLDRGWEFDEMSDRANDPVFDPDPIVIETPTPTQVCEDAELLAHGELLGLDRNADEVERICGGGGSFHYFRSEIPAGHRLLIERGVGYIARDCDVCEFDARSQFNFGDRSTTVVLETHPGADDVLTNVIPLAENAVCENAVLLEVDGPSQTGQLAQGGPVFNGCGIIDAGDSALYFELDTELGLGPVRVTARSLDPTNFSFSLQGISTYAADCGQADPNACIAIDDAYFRSTDTASIEIEPSFGGGRDPARARVILTGYNLRAEDFVISAELVRGPT